MLLACVIVTGVSAPALSQERPASAHRKHIHRQSPADRPLTVTRPPESIYAQPYVGGDPDFVGHDPDEVYGNVANFNPEPYVTSGTQFPFGLDGIGGWGSDLGFEAGQSSTVYQR